MMYQVVPDIKIMAKQATNRVSTIKLPNGQYTGTMIESWRLRWSGYVAQMVEEKKNAYSLFVGKPEGKRPLGRPRCRWVDNVKMDLRDIGWGGMDWINLAEDRDQWRALARTVMNLRVP
jgi:hypothetical protein